MCRNLSAILRLVEQVPPIYWAVSSLQHYRSNQDSYDGLPPVTTSSNDIRALNDTLILFYLYENTSNFVGEATLFEINDNPSMWEISLAIFSGYEGLGYGGYLLNQMVANLLNRNVYCAQAIVKQLNPNSPAIQHLLSKNGFSQEGELWSKYLQT